MEWVLLLALLLIRREARAAEEGAMPGARKTTSRTRKKRTPKLPDHTVPAGEVAMRALEQRGAGRYKLGGGADWRAPNVFAPEGNDYPGTADCTRLIAYAAEYAYAGWYTDAIVDDATGPQRAFRVVPLAEPVRAGDLIVTGRGHGKRDHGGIIVKVLPGFVRLGPKWWKYLRVAHAWGRGGRKRTELDDPTGAVRVWDAAHWRKTGRIIRPLHVTD